MLEPAAALVRGAWDFVYFFNLGHLNTPIAGVCLCKFLIKDVSQKTCL